MHHYMSTSCFCVCLVPCVAIVVHLERSQGSWLRALGVVQVGGGGGPPLERSQGSWLSLGGTQNRIFMVHRAKAARGGGVMPITH